MAIYNLTNLTNGTDIVGVIQGINQLSEDTFGIWLLVSTMIIMYLSLRGTISQDQASNEMLIALTFWAGFMIAVILQLLGLVNEGQTIAIMVLAILSIGILWGKRNS